jgi:hypothetical protein
MSPPPPSDDDKWWDDALRNLPPEVILAIDGSDPSKRKCSSTDEGELELVGNKKRRVQSDPATAVAHRAVATNSAVATSYAAPFKCYQRRVYELDTLLQIRGSSYESDQLSESLPGSALLHLAHCMVKTGKISNSETEIVKNVREYERNHGDLRFRLYPKAIELCASVDHGDRSMGLQRIPNELLRIISYDFDPADMVCLATTWRDFFDKLDYRLRYLLICSFAMERSALREYSLEAAFNMQQVEVSRRMDRDDLNQAILHETNKQLVCFVCCCLHSSPLFSELQRTHSSISRVCLAAESVIELCEHWKVNFVEARELREANLLQPRKCRKESISCAQNPDPRYDGTNAGTCSVVMRRWRSLQIDRSYELIVDSSDILDDKENVVQERLAEIGSSLGCEHLCIDEQMIIRALSKRIRGPAVFVERVVEGEQKCQVCGSMWYLNTSTKHAFPDRRTTLLLTVVKVLDEFKDPWNIG